MSVLPDESSSAFTPEELEKLRQAAEDPLAGERLLQYLAEHEEELKEVAANCERQQTVSDKLLDQEATI